jgi:insecticidal toxin complex protein TccC
MNTTLHAHTPKLAAINPRGRTVANIAYWRSDAQQAPELRVTRQIYDAPGRLITQQDSRLPTPNVRTTYSLSGKPVQTDSVDAGWRLVLSGDAGQAIQTWDGRDTERHVEYDELLRPVVISETANATLTRVTVLPAIVLERFTYGGPQATEHNQCNQLIRHDDTAGTRHLRDYSVLGAVLSEARHFMLETVLPHWPLAESERDTLVEIDALNTRWAFNALGEAIEQIDAMGNRQHFSQTVAGQLKSVDLTLASAAQPQVLVRDIRYNAFGQTESETAGNGVISTTLYRAEDGVLLELHASLAGQPPLRHLKYDYDPVGNILQIEDAAQPIRFFANQRIEPINHYRYDTLYQLIEATGQEIKTGASHGPALPNLQTPPDPSQLAHYTQTYNYDAAGNLLEMRHVGAQSFTRTMRVAPDCNRSLPEGDVDVDFAEAFDANGNLQQLVRGQSLCWDARNQLREVTAVKRDDGPDDNELYIYDGNGQRCRKISSAQASGRTLINEVRYLPGLEIRRTADGEILHVISTQAGRSSVRVLHWQAGQPAGVANDQLRYSLDDHLGSSTLELDTQGGLISQERYYPFGGTAWWAARSATEAKYKTVRYSGKERDATGLYYYGFRYYAPWLTRWINPDPAGDVDGLNLFIFVKNNPLSMTDNTGCAATLLYGFDSVRDQLIQGLSQLSDRSLVTMDKLNAGLGITPETILEDYEAIITDLQEGYDVDEEGIEAFMEISKPYYKGSVDEAASMLQSWSAYLTQHKDMFDIQKKLARYQGAEGKTKSAEFWRKHLDAPLPAAELEQFTAQLQQDPDAFFSSSSGHAKAAMGGITNWLFRRFSKMGLDWMINTQPANDDSTNVWFLDIALKNPTSEFSEMEELTPDMYQSRPYKIDAVNKNTYGPITHSEKRHLEREMATNSNYLKRTKFISVSEAKKYRTG